MSRFVATTSLTQMRPIGSPAELSFPRLRALLEREFPEGAGFILAEPVPRRDGSGIDWYVESDEQIYQLKALPDDMADRFLTLLTSRIGSVQKRIVEYESRGEAAASTKSTALKVASTFPGPENVWIEGDPRSPDARIVITGWGYEHYEPEAGFPDIAKPAPALRSGPVEIGRQPDVDAQSGNATTNPQQSIRRPFAWSGFPKFLVPLLWLLALAFGLGIGWQLLPACGIRLPLLGGVIYGPGQGAFCRIAARTALSPTDAAIGGLNAEANVLEEQLAKKAANCVPPAPTPQSQSAVDETDKRIANEGVDPNSQENSVSLIWDNENDLDLFLVCPNGENVPLRGSLCGAEHKIDMNVSGGPLSDHPVENVTWTDQSLQPGHFRVQVRNYSTAANTPESTPFKVILKRHGRPPQTVEGRVEHVHDVVNVLEFDAP